MKAIRTFRIILGTNYELDLVNTFFEPPIGRNLISISKLDKCSYTFNSGNGCFSLFSRVHCGTGSLLNGLYKLNLNFSFIQSLSLYVSSGVLRQVIDENSAKLWQR